MVARLPGVEVRPIRIQAKTRRQIEAAAAAEPRAQEAPYTFGRIAGGRIGYIAYKSCEDYERFKAFLRETFTAIEREPVEGLIIDIRENGGGQSSLNDLLLLLCHKQSDKKYLRFGCKQVGQRASRGMT